MYVRTSKGRMIVFTVSFVACAITAYYLVFQRRHAGSKNIPRELQSAAQRGCLISQESLANLYLREENYSQAYKWFEKGAEGGFSPAQLGLGEMYLNGQGVSQSYVQAVKWIRMAAEQGLMSAVALLGEMYFNGQGVPKNYVEAEKWIRLAAEENHTGAQYYLAELYYQGYAVPCDLVLAYMWANLSATRDTRAGSLRDTIARVMAPDQVSEAQALSSDIHEIMLGRHGLANKVPPSYIADFYDTINLKFPKSHFAAAVVMMEEDDVDLSRPLEATDKIRWPVFQVDLNRDGQRETIVVSGEFQDEYRIDILGDDFTNLAHMVIEHADAFRSVDFLDLNSNNKYEILIQFIGGSGGFLTTYLGTLTNGEYSLYGFNHVYNAYVLGDLDGDGLVELAGGEMFTALHYGSRGSWIVVPRLWNWTGDELVEVSDRFPRFYRDYATFLRKEIFKEPQSERSKNARIILEELGAYLRFSDN